ncbi:SDR family NAD(P)-dependent oxidoreductase [Pseudomonas sp. MPFS]|uniref:SDR family NAD(P)-dependent oxidoreductase n=1 Tax=Pseudomonas sp. MPFS TaxID=2795724 RepID=UPI001F12E529|nr:SDR family NAD(P)-dependent oxidoreductase [Pseudomonas sp. MPFS]UMZ14042.1 SDR family NAD(P)-dependent oxidoreductase [Pseudomonas sp. MPFS]
MREVLTAVVTGAGGTIGTCISMRLASIGYNLVIIDNHKSNLATLQSKIHSQHPETHVLALEASVSSSREVINAAQIVQDKFRDIDILINNAGISPKLTDGKRIPTLDIDDQEWDFVMKTNLKSIFLMCKYFFSALKPKKGKIINIASMMGVTGSGVDAHQIFPYSVSAAHYSASKAGVINFTKSLARELSEFEIPVYAIAPGAVSGGMGKFDDGFIKYLK